MLKVSYLTHFVFPLVESLIFEIDFFSEYMYVVMMSYSDLEINSNMPSWLVNPYHLDVSIFDFRGVWCIFSLLI